MSASTGLSEGVLLRLGRARWIGLGNEQATNVVYVFTDTECPYCHELYKRLAAAPPAHAQVRFLMVAVLSPLSWNRAAALLESPDPKVALAKLGPPGLASKYEVKAAIREEIAVNNFLMETLKLPATPGIVYEDGEGIIHAFSGVPGDALLAKILHVNAMR